MEEGEGLVSRLHVGAVICRLAPALPYKAHCNVQEPTHTGIVQQYAKAQSGWNVNCSK